MTSHVLYFAIWQSYVKQHYGRLLKYLLKLQDDKPNEDLERRIIDIYRELKWNHIVDYMERQLPSKYPIAYRPF